MKEIFYELGLDEKETEIYLILIKIRKGRVGDILRKTKIERRTIYDVLERLIQKGYLTYYKENNTQIYKPIDPENILLKLEEQKQEFKKIIPQIKSLEEENTETEVEILKGKQGIRTIFQEILQYEEHLGIGDLNPFLNEYKNEAKRLIDGMKKTKHKEKIIYKKGQKIVKTKNGEYKQLNKEQLPIIQTIIYGNTVIQFIIEENPTLIKIKNKKIAETHKEYFKILWEKGK